MLKKEHLSHANKNSEDDYGDDRYHHGFIDKKDHIYISSHDLETKHHTNSVRHESSFSVFMRSFFLWM